VNGALSGWPCPGRAGPRPAGRSAPAGGARPAPVGVPGQSEKLTIGKDVAESAERGRAAIRGPLPGTWEALLAAGTAGASG